MFCYLIDLLCHIFIIKVEFQVWLFLSRVFLFRVFIYFLLVNCWPSENDGQCDVNIEYELLQENLQLNDVVISIPVP